MSITCATERSLLDHEELALIGQTHYPAISDVAAEALLDLKKRLAQMRDKEKTLAFRKSRVARGKEEARSDKAAGNAEHRRRRKQIFAQAVKRINNELSRLKKFAAKASLVRAQFTALALRRENLVVHHPNGGWTQAEGMASKVNTKNRREKNRRVLGRVLQANKVAQARRDGKQASA